MCVCVYIHIYIIVDIIFIIIIIIIMIKRNLFDLILVFFSMVELVGAVLGEKVEY